MKLLRGSFFHRRKRDGEPLARHLLVRSPPEPPNVQARRGENWFRCVCAQSIEAPFAARATLLDGLTALL